MDCYGEENYFLGSGNTAESIIRTFDSANAIRASTCREISLQKEILACARKRARKSNLPGNGKEI